MEQAQRPAKKNELFSQAPLADQSKKAIENEALRLCSETKKLLPLAKTIV